jgi:SAM-dependent methyltransferase
MVLQSHYERKYADDRAEAVRPVPLTDRPRDRYEATAFLAGSGHRLLEIGPGSGNVLLTLLPKFDDFVGIELSENRASQLRRLFADQSRVTILAGDFEIVDVPGPFDVAVLSDVVEHLLDPIAALERVGELLSPGGRAVVHTPNVAKWTRRIKLAFGRFPSTASRDEGLLSYYGAPTDLYDEGHLHYFTFRSLERVLLERCGFAHVERFGYGARRARRWPTLFSECCVVAEKAP